VRTTETDLPAVNPQRMNPSNSRAALYLEALGFGGHTLSGALRALFPVAYFDLQLTGREAFVGR